MNNPSPNFFVERSRMGRCVDITVTHEDPFGVVAIAAPLTFQASPDGEAYDSGPTMRLRPDDAQRLMDELWRVGLRPTEGTGSAGSLAATERHLKDMQAIAMGLLRGDF